MPSRAVLCGLLSLAASLLPATGWAQYAVQSTGPVTGTCTPDVPNNRTLITINAPGTVNLPAGGNNLVTIGGSDPANLVPSTVTPASGPLPGPTLWLVNRLATPADPIALGMSFYPALAGAPTGTGFGTSVGCDSADTFSATAPAVVSAEPGAPYSVSYTGTVIGGTCTTTNISGAINGSIYLPPQPDNFVVYVSLNGGPATSGLNTYNPASRSGVEFFSYDIAPTAIPYSITGTAFPARNGVPVGTGVSLTYYCTSGGLTISPPQAVPAPTGGIPTLSQVGLILLSGLLGYAAWRVRRTDRDAG